LPAKYGDSSGNLAKAGWPADCHGNDIAAKSPPKTPATPEIAPPHDGSESCKKPGVPSK
jgi:hypothetical protein